MSEMAMSFPDTESVSRIARHLAYGAAVLATAGILVSSCDNESGGGGGGRPKGGWGAEQEAREWGASTWREPPEGFYVMRPGLAAAVVVHEAIQEAMCDR